MSYLLRRRLWAAIVDDSSVRSLTSGIISSAVSSGVETTKDGNVKQVQKLRPNARKPKVDIFTRELGKRPKIHLKPSLLSERKSPIVNKEFMSTLTRIEKRSVQRRQKANLAVNEMVDEVGEPREDEVPRALINSKTSNHAKVVVNYEGSEGGAYECEELEEDGAWKRTALDRVEEVLVSVDAFFLARSVDLKALAQETSVNVVSGRNHVVISLDDRLVRDESYIPMPDCLSNDRFIVVFQYGSVVLFNFDQVSGQDEMLEIVKKHSKEVLSDPKKDNYRILVRPGLERWSQGGADKIMVKKLDMDGIRIISLVLSQSIALDHYTRGIDEMLNTFGELNRKMELTGTFKMKRKALFKLVAAANTSLADAILRLGLLERSDVAWQNARYDRIWEHMREDFELDDRFESLEFKIGIIQHNVKFFLDILQNRKSDTLEWIIIVLIAAEICVGLYEIAKGV